MLLVAMRNHRMRPLVQQHAASALQNLAGNHVVNKTRIAEEGGIALIIAAMTNHPNESQVCSRKNKEKLARVLRAGLQGSPVFKISMSLNILLSYPPTPNYKR